MLLVGEAVVLQWPRVPLVGEVQALIYERPLAHSHLLRGRLTGE